jgi:hypothetical protein
MAVAARKMDVKELYLDKKEVQRMVAEQMKIMGIPDDPTATPEKAQALTEACGIKPEENYFSRGIIAARNE